MSINTYVEIQIVNISHRYHLSKKFVSLATMKKMLPVSGYMSLAKTLEDLWLSGSIYFKVTVNNYYMLYQPATWLYKQNWDTMNIWNIWMTASISEWMNECMFKSMSKWLTN